MAGALHAVFDHVRPHVRGAKGAPRRNDAAGMHVLKSILKASGRKGVPQGGVSSPWRSHLDRTAVARRLARATAVTRRGTSPSREDARLADELVMVVEAYREPDGRLPAVATRLRQAWASRPGASKEEKSRLVALAPGDTCSVLGFDGRRVKSRRGVWRPWYPPRQQKRTALRRQLQDIVRRPESPPGARGGALLHPRLRGWVRYVAVGDASRGCGGIKDGVAKKVRRHRRRARHRQGLGGQRRRRRRRYDTLRLWHDYRGRRPQPKALSVRSVP